MTKKKFSKTELINKLQKLEKNYGDTSYDTIEKCNDIPHPSTFRNYFDGGISQARKEANVKIWPYKSTDSFHKAIDQFLELEREEKLVIEENMSNEMKNVRNSEYTLSEIREKANLIRDYPKKKQLDTFKMIKELSEIEEKVVTQDIASKNTSYSANEYSYQFESFSHALKLANKTSGVNNSQIFKNMTGYYDSDKALSSINNYCSDKNYYVYRIKYTENTFYVGVTNNIKRRIGEHSTKSKSKIKNKQPVGLYIESYNDKEEANNRETELTFETAIEFNTNKVYGGHKPYITQ